MFDLKTEFTGGLALLILLGAITGIPHFLISFYAYDCNLLTRAFISVGWGAVCVDGLFEAFFNARQVYEKVTRDGRKKDKDFAERLINKTNKRVKQRMLIVMLVLSCIWVAAFYVTGIFEGNEIFAGLSLGICYGGFWAASDYEDEMQHELRIRSNNWKEHLLGKNKRNKAGD